MGFACGCEDLPEFYQAKIIHARKEHTCIECDHIILPGEEYQRVFMLFESEALTYKTCERCSDLIKAFKDIGYCHCFGEFFSGYGDWLEEERSGFDENDNPVPEQSGYAHATAIRLKHKNWKGT